MVSREPVFPRPAMLTRSALMLANYSQDSCLDIAMMVQHVNTARLGLLFKSIKNQFIHNEKTLSEPFQNSNDLNIFQFHLIINSYISFFEIQAVL